MDSCFLVISCQSGEESVKEASNLRMKVVSAAEGAVRDGNVVKHWRISTCIPLLE